MEVHVEPYDAAWSGRFEHERARLATLLDPWLDGDVEHVGSTAVAGLAAKPIVDMVAPVRSHAAAREALPALERAGWVHWPEDPHAAWRHWFVRPRVDARTHHLYLMERAEPEFDALLAWRDHLRARPDVARAYEALKRDLAAKFPRDRAAYADGKTAFLREAFVGMGRALPHPREYARHDGAEAAGEQRRRRAA